MSVPDQTTVGPSAVPRPSIAAPGRTSERNRRGALVRRALVVADVLGLALAFLVAELLFGAPQPDDRLTLGEEYLVFLATLPGWILVAKLYRLYDHDDERADHSTLDDLIAVFHLATVGAWFVIVVTWISGAADSAMAKLVTFWAVAVILVTLGRSAARAICRRRSAYVQRTLVLGAGEVGQLVARKLVQHREYGMELVGFLDDAPRPIRPDLGGVPVLGPPEELASVVAAHGIDRVVVAFSGQPHAETLEVLRTLRRLDVQIDLVPRLFEAVGPHATIHTVESLPLIGLPAAKRLPFSRAIKRAADVAGAALGLLAAAPLFLYAAWRIPRESPGPVFFRQTRLGGDMRPFTLLKFRTMRTDVDDAPHREFIRQTMSASAAPADTGLYKLDREDAVTPFGRWLRRTSLDELPQLLNVLRGEMSLVGPRPCLEYETEHFQPHHFERFLVPQGITGLWQVTARAHATFGEALDMDVTYARGWSLGLDLWLLCRTPLHVLRRKATA